VLPSAASLHHPVSHAFSRACAQSEDAELVQAFDDVAPSGAEVTDYDREHIMLYYCLLDRKERHRVWSETTRAFFAVDVAQEPERARRIYDSHLARAMMLAEIPEFAHTFRMAPYLWG
jgi:hypothetical protein